MFNEFNTSTKQDWLKAAKESLKSADAEGILVQKIPENLKLSIYYDQSDLINIPTVEYFEKENIARPRKFRIVEYLQVRNPELTGQQIETGFNGGADDVLIDLSEANAFPSFNRLSEGINAETGAFHFLIPSNKDTAYFLKEINLFFAENKTLKGSIAVNSDELFQDTPEASTLLKSILYSVNINSSISLNIYNKNTDNQLNIITNYLSSIQTVFFAVKQETDISETVLDRLILTVPIGLDYFHEIAGLRALRLLSNRLFAVYYPEKNRQPKIHAVTTPNNHLPEEEHLNMLSNTTQVMAALAGGCHSISVIPHTPNHDDFSRLTARNIPILLREESSFTQEADPAKGSYYIEVLTYLTAKKAWELFQKKSTDRKRI